MVEVSDKSIHTAKLVLGKCAANDPWFPQPNEGTILAWAEHIMITGLEAGDLLAAVTRAYAEKSSGFKPLPGDILSVARSIRQDRLMREPKPAQEPRREIKTMSPAQPPKVDENMAENNVPGPIRANGWEVTASNTAGGWKASSTAGARQAAFNALAEALSIPSATIRKAGAGSRTIRCPWCGAGPAYPCHIPHTQQTLKQDHPARIEAAK